MTIVAFDYQAWARAFPEFIPLVTEPVALRHFATAQLFINNTDASPIGANPPNNEPRTTILNLATAHVAKLFTGTVADNQTGGPSLVGRIASAAEGSVNVATELPSTDSPSRDWWAQTPYGLAVWNATAPYRTALYIPPPPEFATSFGFGFPPIGGRW